MVLPSLGALSVLNYLNKSLLTSFISNQRSTSAPLGGRPRAAETRGNFGVFEIQALHKLEQDRRQVKEPFEKLQRMQFRYMP